MMKLRLQLFASGTITFARSGNLQGKIVWSSAKNGDNTSKVTCNLYAKTWTGGTTGKSWSGNVNIDGTNNSFSSLSSSTTIGSNWVLLKTYTKTVTHNEDGTKSITISGSVKGPSGTTLANTTSSGSANVTLDTLVVSNSMTLPSEANIGGIITINITKGKDTYGSVLSYINNSQSGAVEEQIVTTYDTTYDWTIPTSIYNTIPNSTSANISIFLITIDEDGNKVSGSVVVSKTLVAKVDSTPDISNISAHDTSSYTTLTKDSTRLIVGASIPKFTWDATPSQGATITSQEFDMNPANNGQYTTGTLEIVPGDIQHTILVTDSRGYNIYHGIIYEQIGCTIIPWEEAKFTVSGSRKSGDKTHIVISIQGTYFKGAFDAAGQNVNSFNMVCKYGEDTSVSGGQINIPLTAFTINEDGSLSLNDYDLGVSLDTSKTYYFTFTFTDSIKTTELGMFRISKSYPLIFWKNNLVRIYGDLQVKGKISADSNIVSAMEIYADTDKRLLRENELYYKSGDTFETENYTMLAGIVTDATGVLIVGINTPKRLDNITSITCNSVNVEARGISGYLNSEPGFIEYVGRQNYTVTCFKSTNSTITIWIRKSSKYTNTTNNTPVMLYGNFKFTFE